MHLLLVTILGGGRTPVKMYQTSRVPPPAIQSIKSMPSEFKLTGNPTPHLLGKHGNLKVGSTDVIASSSPENGAIGRKVFEELHICAGDVDLIDEDSPYGKRTMSLESRPSIGDEEVEPVPLSLPSILKSSRECRWSDTTPYASKKVLLAFNSNFNIEVG